MKLLLVISFIAASYAAKLDRTYLPPETAKTAGGSPGSLAAPKFGATPNTSQYPLGPFDTLDNTQNGRPAFEQSNAAPGFNRFNNQADNGAGDFNDISSPGGSFGQSPSGNQAFGSNQPIGSAPQRAQAAGDVNAEILRYTNDNDGETFSYSFETSNGIAAEESGVATNGVRAQGAFSYTGDDGNGYSITYTADENGYQPQGEHLPTPHPIPEEILRSIEKNAEAAAAGTQEGAYRPEEYENENVQAYNQPSNFNQGQATNLPQDQTSYSYTRPSEQRPGQQGSTAQTGPGSVNSYNQQPGFKSQQGPSSQTAFGTTGFGTPNSGLSNNIEQNNLQNRGDQGYNYNRPQSNIPTNSNSFGQEPSKQIDLPSKSNSQNQIPSRPTFNSGLPTDLNSSPFSQSNKGSQNPFGQNNNQFNRQGQNQGSDGYNYDRPQPALYTPAKNSFNQGTLGQTQPSNAQDQNNFPFRPITFNNQQPRPGQDPSPSQLSNNQQTFGSNRPAIPTNKISEPGNQFNQRGQDTDRNGYNYDRPQTNQFAKPNANSFGQQSFKSQPSQSQAGIPFNTQTSGNQRPSFNFGINSNAGPKPSPQFGSNRNQQSYQPTGPTNQLGQPNARLGQNEPNKQSSGYNYDKPQSNQFNPSGQQSQGRPDFTRNQGNLPSKPMTQDFNFQRPNFNSGSSGFAPSFQSNNNQQFNRPVGSQRQPGPVLGSNSGNSQDGSQYMPQKFGSNVPTNQNQAFTRVSAASQAPYSYDRPSSTINNPRPNFGSQGPQTLNGSSNQGYLPPNQGKGEQFGGPRQPPSFSAEEGYKY